MASIAIPGIPTLAFPERPDRREGELSVRNGESLGATESAMKILIVDDSSVARKSVEQALFGQPYSLIFATTGQQAVELFLKHRPSLVIMDWMMPDLNGVEICRRMRAISSDFYTHIIMLTAKTDKASVVEGLRAGADDYLTKPFHEEELLARVGVGLRTLGLHRQIEAKNKKLEKLALTDGLTGLPNRRAIEDWGTREVSGATRHDYSLWVIVADLDRFKQVNDTFGHNAGDEVLKTFAKVLKAHTRRSDICGRHGGEEFMMVMTHSTAKDVEKAIERIRAEFETTSLNFGGCNILATASFGIAGFEAGQAKPCFDELVSRADAALYSAKRAGRNRVEIAPSILS